MAAAPFIAVIGAGDAPAEVRALAFEVGREIAAHGAVLVCGGLGGVMEAAAQGVREAGGHTIGILPGYNRQSANRYIEFAIATGMGEARNAIVIGSADAAVALTGEGGTLAEIGFALKLKRPVVALGAWDEIAGLHRADTAAAAVSLALKLAGTPTEAPTR
jgi:uncharacterized protein (TIGR00725 family)